MSAFFIYKIVHFVGLISWFAGLFYLGRMFVYHREALDAENRVKEILTKQFELMENRVYKIIMNPALIITWIFGLLMIHARGWTYLQESIWLHYKLSLVGLLTFYHWYCKSIISKLKAERLDFSSMGFRLFNEVPTVFMITIVSIAVFKNGINLTTLFLSILLIIVVLILLTKFYKYIRSKSQPIK